MQLELINEVSTRNEKVTKVSGFILTKRDHEICKFISDMKFASIEELHAKFFFITPEGLESKTDRAVQRRLRNLESNGYLVGKTYFHQRKKFFFPTLKAYRMLKAMNPSVLIPYPTQKADIRTFEHDFDVLQLRLYLESKSGVTDWQSDKTLRSNESLRGDLPEAMVPDAIFKNKSGEKVALEYERSQKAKIRYKTKIKLYVNLIRSDEALKPFNKVIYFCENANVFKILSEEIKVYGKYFEVLMFPAEASKRNQIFCGKVS